MSRLARVVVFGGLVLSAAVGAAGDAQAQYYPPPGPAPGYPPPGYYPQPGPPPGYRRPVGFRCDTERPTPYGPRPLVCALRRPRPLDAPCACASPPPPPGYPYLPPLAGRVIP